MATLGQQLKAAREAKGISESDAGRATKILTKLIRAMENDDFSDMAAPMYAKGFIRLYADYLGIDPAPLVEEYMQRHAPARKPLMEEPPDRFTRGPHRREPNGQTGGQAAARFNPRAVLNAIRSFLKDRLPARRRSSRPVSPQEKKPGRPLRDIRVIAAIAAGLVVLLVLISALSTCARRQNTQAEPAAGPRTEDVRTLLNEPLPDLYLVEPGQIERSR